MKKAKRDNQIYWEYDHAILRGDYVTAGRIAWINPDQGLWVWTWDPNTGADILGAVICVDE